MNKKFNCMQSVRKRRENVLNRLENQLDTNKSLTEKDIERINNEIKTLKNRI